MEAAGQQPRIAIDDAESSHAREAAKDIVCGSVSWECLALEKY